MSPREPVSADVHDDSLAVFRRGQTIRSAAYASLCGMLSVLVGCGPSAAPPPRKPLGASGGGELELSGATQEASREPYVDAVFAPRAVTLAKGVHLLGALAPGAAYAVECSEGFVLIDAGVEKDAGPLVAQLTELGLPLKKLLAVLLTHVHGDHSLGARRLRELTAARIYAGAEDVEPLRKGGPREAFFSTFHAPGLTAHATPVDATLREDSDLQFGDLQVRVLTTPGHTPGSLCFQIQRDGKTLLFTGDTVATLHDVVGTYSARLSARYRGDAKSYRRSLEKLRALPPPDLVLPGHPRMGRRRQSPRISATDWHNVLDEGIAELQRTLDRHRADGRDFLDGTAKPIVAGVYYLGNREGHAAYALVHKGKLYCVNAPGDERLPAFLRQQLEQLAIRLPITGVLLTEGGDAVRGLPSLVAATGCQVLGAADTIGAVKDRLPAETKLTILRGAETDPLGVSAPLELPGLGTAATAWRIAIGKQTVVFTGGLPLDDSLGARRRLHGHFARQLGLAANFRTALDQLQKWRPTIWLPATPVHEQNANLYDDRWQRVLAACREVVVNSSN